MILQQVICNGIEPGTEIFPVVIFLAGSIESQKCVVHKVGRKVGMEGTTTIYAAIDTRITIESRKRHIPHANGSGTWDHTSYFVLDHGEEIAEKWHLEDAKKYAEAARETQLDMGVV